MDFLIYDLKQNIPPKCDTDLMRGPHTGSVAHLRFGVLDAWL